MMKKWLTLLALSAGLVSTGNAAYINRLKTFTGTASQWPWQLNADGTWTLKQPAESDLKGSTTVNAAQYGAVCDGVTNDAPAIQSAINAVISAGSGTVRLPRGTCLMGTSYASGYTPRGIGPYNLTVQNANNIRIEGAKGEGTILTTMNGANLSVILWVFQSNNVEVSNIKFVGNNAGLSPGDNNGALMLYSVNGFWVHDISTSVFQGSQIVGNWQFNGVYDRVTQSVPAAATGFDLGSIQNVKWVNWTAVGASGGQGVQIIYDPPNANPSYNTTGVTFCGYCAVAISNNLTFENPDVSGFTTGISINESRDVYIKGGSIHKNLTTSGNFSTGIAVGVSNSGTTAYNININGTSFYNNGSASGSAGLRGGLILNSNTGPVVANVTNAKFYDNNDTGIVNLGVSTTLHQSGNTFGNLTTSSQTTPISGYANLANGSSELMDYGLTLSAGTGIRLPDSSTLSFDVNKTNIFNLTASGASLTVPLTSTVSTGTAPFVVASTTKVANLYADRAASADTLTVMTTAGDMVYGGAGGAATRLAAGTTSTILVGGTVPSWGSTLPSAVQSNITALGTVTSGTLSGLTLAGNTTLPGSGRISSSGYIGVGTSPSYPVDILSTGAAAQFRVASSGDYQAGVFFANSNRTWSLSNYPSGTGNPGALAISDEAVGAAILVQQATLDVTLYSSVASTSASTGALKVFGGVGIAGALYVGAEVVTGTTTVGSLPACNAGRKSARHFVTDANATTFASTVAAGGANNVPVVCNGASWIIG